MGDTERRSFSVTRVGPRSLRLRGRLDIQGEGALGDAFARVRVEGGHVYLDLSDLTSMGSTGMRAIVTAARRLPQGDVVVHGAHARLAKVLDITGIKLSEKVRVVPGLLRPALQS